jgi:hypothetical protein
MGRRAFSSPRRRVNLHLDEEILAQFELLHFDPVRGGANYGALSSVVNRLLAEYVKGKTNDAERVDREA